MSRYLILLLLLLVLVLVPACLFNHDLGYVDSWVTDSLGDYMGLEEGVIWRYSLYTEDEKGEDTYLMGVLSREEKEDGTLFTIREEWGSQLSQEPLQGYYWILNEDDGAYYEVGRWNQREDFFYDEEEYLFILPEGLSKGDRVFENYTFGDSFSVQGQERVQVEAGEFEAWLLESLWGDKEEGPWEEDRLYFVPHVGMVKREMVRGYSNDGEVLEEFSFTLELQDLYREEE